MTKVYITLEVTLNEGEFNDLNRKRLRANRRTISAKDLVENLVHDALSDKTFDRVITEGLTCESK